MVAELFGSSVQMRECAVEAALLVDLHTLFHIFLAPGDHQVDQAGKLARRGGDRDGLVLSGEACAVLGANEGLAVIRRAGSTPIGALTR